MLSDLPFLKAARFSDRIGRNTLTGGSVFHVSNAWGDIAVSLTGRVAGPADYHNKVTNETRWDPPEGSVSEPEPGAASEQSTPGASTRHMIVGGTGMLDSVEELEVSDTTEEKKQGLPLTRVPSGCAQCHAKVLGYRTAPVFCPRQS